MKALVFSKDRALQLDGFLRSWERYVGRHPVHVLYRATTPRHQHAYDDVFRTSTYATPRIETDFKSDVMAWLPTSGDVVCFVDDQLFIRHWDGWTTPGLSLRHGLHLTSNYSTREQQPLPPYCDECAGEDLVSWRWSEGRAAWGYPLALDGHIFDAHEFSAWLEPVAFSSPNTLEASLQRYLPQFATRVGFCYRQSKVVNIPWNRVQAEYPNRCGGLFTAEDFLAMWEDGHRLNLDAYDGLVPQSVHEELTLELEPK